ncbi:hypothetical protein GOV11_04770 [Candidatus Woesearchaeota archaeon]|nr:hypothetical protein [Candidatus Woesearchaeota archaeon]
MTRLKRKEDLDSESQDDALFGTPWEVADYRAERMCIDVDTVIEVGAGTGFQTQAFSERARKIIAVDIDGERLKRAQFDRSVTIIQGDVLEIEVFNKIKKNIEGRVVVFLNPQRPTASKARTLSEISPNPERFVEAFKEITADIAIEVPPFLDDVPWDCEREFMSIGGELNRQTIYMGNLKKCDLSVVRLPEWKRVEHTGVPPQLASTQLENPQYILDPDKALIRAGIVAKALPAKYQEIPLGNRRVFATEELGGSIFKTYKILATGTKEEMLAKIPELDAVMVVLQSAISEREQKSLLREFNNACTGIKRFHVFMGDKFYIAEQV